MVDVTFWVLVLAGNVLLYVLDKWSERRSRRKRLFAWVCDAAEVCRKSGWSPVRYRGQGTEHPEIDIRKDGETFTLKVRRS